MRTFILLILIVLFVFPSHGHAKVLDIKSVQSESGIKAWLVEDHSVPVIALQFSFLGSGAILDPADKQGLAMMVSNTMDEGAGDLDAQAFQKQLQDYSISLSFNSSRDHFSGSVKTLTQNKDKAFELLKLALMQPRFDQEAIDRMRGSNASRIRSSLSNPKWIAARILNDRAYEGHVYAQNSGGTLTTLNNITRDDLVRFHETAFGKNNLVVSAAGDITVEQLKSLLNSVFNDLPDAERPALPAKTELKNKGQTILFEKDIPQTIIEVMQPGIARDDPNYHTAQVMNFVLGSSGFGSRLTKVIREERGLTYGIYSYFSTMNFFDGLAVSTSTENSNVQELLGLLKAEWNRLKTDGITEKELKDAKTYLIGSLPLSLTSTDRIAGLLLSLQQDELPIDYLDQRETKILATSADDVQTLSRELLNSDDFLVVLVGSPQNITPDQNITTLPNAE